MATRSIPRHWREAASLIITGRVPNSVDNFDYKVLLLERNKKSRFVPGNFVFPGGAVDKEDFSDKWWDVLCAGTGRTPETLTSELKMTGHKPPILYTDRGTSVPAEIGLRICAIRECFEESGLLLARPTTGTTSPPNYTSIISNNHIPEEVLKHYQVMVGKDAAVFRELCMKYEVIPDLWGLKEWGNWITPAPPEQPGSGPKVKPLRFDTVFFICAIDKITKAHQDCREIVASQWMAPDFLVTGTTNRIKIRRPQIYQFALMSGFRSQDALVEFFTKRAPLGLARWMGVAAVCTDGMIALLPGDDLYPCALDYKVHYPLITTHLTVEALLSNPTRNTHCMVSYPGTGDISIHCNIHMKLGHPRPQALNISGEKAKL